MTHLIVDNEGEIEISIDGSEYRSIGQVQAAGNSTIKQDYKWVDATPSNSFNYYRLVQFDVDGANDIYGPVLIDNRNKVSKIIKRVNMMGQEVNENAKGVIIEIYEDGTMIRTIK